MFQPKYTISDKLLANIKRITTLINDLNSRSYPRLILTKLELRANSLSAYASTSIEGNPLPLTEVKRLLKSLPRTVRDSEKEVLNYNNVLQWLNELANKKKTVLDSAIIIKTQKQVVNGLIGEDQTGQWRKAPVFVHDPRAKIPVYLPPDHHDVPKLMSELIDYVTQVRPSLDPLIVAGIFHKQFVIIHPFVDGNGRTARLLTKLLLARMGLNTFNLFSFENYYNRNVTKYFEYVGVKGNYYEIYQTIDFTDWLEYFTDGIIDELLRVSQELSQLVITPQTSLQPYHQKILDHIKEHGFITDSGYAELTDRARATRHKDLRKLIDLKLIKPQGEGRATYYKLHEEPLQ